MSGIWDDLKRGAEQRKRWEMEQAEPLLSSVYTRTPENQDRVARGARQCGCNECSSWLFRNGYGPVSGDQEGTSG